MFPWVDGFHWTATHIIFLSLFFAAVVIIVATFTSAIFRAASDFREHRANEMCWRENFAELPKKSGVAATNSPDVWNPGFATTPSIAGNAQATRTLRRYRRIRRAMWV